MDIALKHYFIIFLKFFSEIFCMDYVFAAKYTAKAKVLNKRFRPEQHFQMGGMVNMPFTLEHAWLVEIEINGKETNVEVSENFYKLVRKGNSLFVQYQTSWADNNIHAKLLH